MGGAGRALRRVSDLWGSNANETTELVFLKICVVEELAGMLSGENASPQECLAFPQVLIRRLPSIIAIMLWKNAKKRIF